MPRVHGIQLGLAGMLVSYTTLARRCRAFAFAHTTGQTVVFGTAPVRGSALEAREIERWVTPLIFFCLLSQLSRVSFRRLRAGLRSVACLAFILK